MINHYSIATFVTSILVITLGLAIYSKGRRNNANTAFFLLSLSIFSWLFFVSIAYNCSNSARAEFYMRMCYLGITFISITTFHFDVEFLRILRLRFILPILYGVGFLFCLLIIKTDYVVNGFYYYFWGTYPKAGILHPVFLIFLYLVATASLIILIISYLKIQTSSIRKAQIKYIIVSYFFLLASTVDFIPVYGISLYPFGYLPVTIFLSLVAYTTIKYRLLDITIAVTRTGIFVVVYSFILGIPFLLTFGWQEKLRILLGSNWWILPLVSSTVLATTGPFIYLFIQKRAEARLLQEQRRYQATLRQASLGMGRIKDLKKLMNLIVYIVTRTVHLEHSSIYLFDDFEKKYFIEASRNRGKPKTKGAIEYTSPLTRYLYKVKEPIVYEEIKQRTQDYQDPELVQVESALHELDAAVVVPSFIEQKLLAIVVLGRKLSGKLYSEDDLSVFSILANQAAVGIENIRHYADAQKAREELFRAEKLAYVGRMASSIVHEIRNPLTVIKTYIDYFPEKYNDPEFREKFQKLIPGEVDRIDRVVRQLLDVARQRRPVLIPLNIVEEMNATLALLENNLRLKKINVKKDYESYDIIINGDAEQLRQVFLNLFLNAIQAMDMGDCLTVGIRCKETGSQRSKEVEMQRSREAAGFFAEITVSDTGEGITPENLKRLFSPFFTTKKDGVGLGLAITREIIEAHGGRIGVTSRLGMGTVFIVTLPSA